MMKTYGILCFVLALAMFVSPIAVFDLRGFSAENVKSSFSALADSAKDNAEKEKNASEDTVTVLQAASGNVAEMDTLEYLVGCVACEMPPSYHEEALKAQTVAAYTNLQRLKRNPDGKAGTADITDDTGTHQGYYDAATRREKWGEKYEVYNEKITAAVLAVLGQTLTYEGAPVTAAYFALCPGRTESAQAVWGNDVPYLQSVTSTGDRLSPELNSEVTFSAEELREALRTDSEIALGDDPAAWFSENLQVSENGTGTVTAVTVGGKTMTGQQLRSVLGLSSPAFTVAFQDGNFTFSVTGSGHFVGMSQYGADYMARQGADYKEILAHYYPGTEIESLGA